MEKLPWIPNKMHTQLLLVPSELGKDRRLGCSTAVDIDPSVSTVDDLRDAVENEMGIPREEQTLISGNTLLSGKGCYGGLSRVPPLPSSTSKALSFFRVGGKTRNDHTKPHVSRPSTSSSPSLLELGVKPGDSIHVHRKIRGGGLICLLREVRGFYNPFVGLGYWFFPCALNVYGIYKFKHQNFWENKPVRDASGIMGEKGVGGGDGH